MTLIVKGICRDCGTTIHPHDVKLHMAHHHRQRIEAHPHHQRQIGQDRMNGIVPAKDERKPFKHHNAKEQ